MADYLSRRYGCAIDSERLYILNSTSQAYAWLTMLLCDPEDYVLYPQPGYPLIESICRLTGTKSVPYRLVYDGSWMIDYVSIREQLERYNTLDSQHRIKAIILINPNNPTASYVKKDEREEIIKLCHEYDVAIIADEVFYDFPLDSFDDRQRFVNEDRVLCFTFDGFSKMLGAADVKVGWIYVSGDVQVVEEAQRRLDIIADDFLPMSSLITQHIPELLDKADEQSEIILTRCRTNLDWLKKYVMSSDETLGVVSVLRTEGSWSALIRFPSSIDDDELGLALLDRVHLMSAPGYFFDIQSNGYMAISLLPPHEQFMRMIKDTIMVIESFIR